MRQVRLAFGRVRHCKIKIKRADRTAISASTFVMAVLVDAVVVRFAGQCLQIAMELPRQGDAWTSEISRNPMSYICRLA